MNTQFDLFRVSPPASTDPLVGVTVELPDASKCNGTVALIGAGSGLHCAALRCALCGVHRGWLARETHDFIYRIISEFGPLTAPISIRRGKGTSSNSGSDPEYAPAAQPASRYAYGE